MTLPFEPIKDPTQKKAPLREFLAAARAQILNIALFLIAAVIVGVSVGWLWALIPVGLGFVVVGIQFRRSLLIHRKELRERNRKPPEPEFVLVVRAYAGALKLATASGRPIEDAATLPYPKEKIKESLITYLQSTDNARVREHLQASFLFLSDWQESPFEKAPSPESDAGDPVVSLDAVVRAQKERTALKRELKALELW